MESQSLMHIGCNIRTNIRGNIRIKLKEIGKEYPAEM